MKNFLKIGLVVVAAFWAQSSFASLAVVDMQKAIQTTEQGKKAKATVEAEFNKRKKELDKKQADIRKMQEDLEKRKSVLSEEVLERRSQELQEEMMRFQKTLGENQLEIQKKEKEVLEPILVKLRRVIDKLALERKLTLVLDKNSQPVIYTDKSIDITDDVIKAFEKEK